MDYVTRLMKDRDIPQAIDIDREAFPTQWPHPTYSSLKQELRNRLARYMVVCKENGLDPNISEEAAANKSLWHRVVDLKHLFDHDRFFGEERPEPSNDYVIGMAGLWVMAGEAHITTIAVRNAYRRQGIGERLLISIVDTATQLKASVVTLEVRISNKQAQALYRKYHFHPAGTRPRYYSDDGEDALLMSTDDITSSSFQSVFQQLREYHQQKQEAPYC